MRELTGNIFDGATMTGREFPASQTRFLVPCEPSKLLTAVINHLLDPVRPVVRD